jgi:hypothetical protein
VLSEKTESPALKGSGRPVPRGRKSLYASFHDGLESVRHAEYSIRVDRALWRPELCPLFGPMELVTA